MLSSLLFRPKKRDTNAATMQTPKPPPPPTFNPLPPGLKTLTLDDDPLLYRHCVKRGAISSPTSSLSRASSVDSVEIIKNDDGGEEDDDKEEEEEEEPENACWGLYGWRKRPCRYPPAIPLLARTANLTCRMPWVLKRVYKGDGRLVIQEVRVKHHEYFRASREGGRLTLRHVYLDDKSPLFHTAAAEEEEEENPTSISQPSSTISPAPLSCFLKREEAEEVGGGGEGTDSEARLQRIRCRAREAGRDFQSQTPRIMRPTLMEVSSSMMELSSSMPEPIFPKGCFDRKPSLLCQIPRMRTVHT